VQPGSRRSLHLKVRRYGDSLIVLGGSASRAEIPAPDDDFRVHVNGHGPPWTPDRAASASPLYEWRELIGIAPAGTASVRAVVGDRAVEATLADRLFVVSWPVDTKASLLVAFDVDGAEMARLTREDLETIDDIPGG